MNKRELIAELERRIRFLTRDLCSEHCVGGHPAIGGKIWAYKNILRLVKQSRMK